MFLQGKLNLDFSEEALSRVREALKSLLQEKSVLRGDFTLASGQKSSYYLDTRLSTLDPAGGTLLSYLLLAKYKDKWNEFEAIAGPALGATAMVTNLCQLSYLYGAPRQSVYVRKESKKHGTSKSIEGNLKRGDRVLILEDVVTSGGSSLQAVKVLREYGAEVNDLCCLVAREQAGIESLKEHHLNVSYIFEAVELLS